MASTRSAAQGGIPRAEPVAESDKDGMARRDATVRHETGVSGSLLNSRTVATRKIFCNVPIECAIGGGYRESGLASHYFERKLAWHFNDYAWFDETRALTPLPAECIEGAP